MKYIDVRIGCSQELDECDIEFAIKQLFTLSDRDIVKVSVIKPKSQKPCKEDCIHYSKGVCIKNCTRGGLHKDYYNRM